MKRIWSMLAASVLALPCRALALPERTFAADLRQRLEETYIGATLTSTRRDPLSLRLTRRNGYEGGVIDLRDIYAYCRTAQPADCEEAKNAFVAMLRPKYSAVFTAERLRLLVRDSVYMRQIWSTRGDESTIHQQIGEDLYALLVTENEELFAVVPAAKLGEMGLSSDAAFALALAQTQAKLPRPPTAAALAEGYIVRKGYDYGSAILIDLGAWRDLAETIGPDLFVAVMSDDFVSFGKMPDGEPLAGLAKAVAEDCAELDRCISPHLYRFRRGRWVIAY